ncbi:hypothetical protein [Enhygromyxa salina]|uniref:Outer membrane protein beta-barrel domain-containing protein n=1 Tax=Enhygromyxa salina TaxID=215803 RepID=A0A2S9XWR3_9BACT|nr:hypothetical protein [Enhygromyxa salina]PRP97306.1 hypothetical protein ENSA7_66560 [Enhygromyxa salina]
MAVRRLAPLCLTLLLPSLAFAAPAADGPAVQHPTKAPDPSSITPVETHVPTTAGPEASEQTVTEDTQPDVADPGANPAADPEANPAPDAAPGPGAMPPPEHPGDATQPPAEQEDLSSLLVSDEPESAPPRVRVSNSATPNRVDRSERLRNYYSRIYRPAHNPARIYFAARAAYALSGTSSGTGGGRMGSANVELGQTWNFIGYGIGAAVYGGDLTFGEDGVEKFGGLLVGGGPSLGLGRLGLFGRGYLDVRAGYNFFYAPVSSTRVGVIDPPDAAPHGPKLQLDAGLLFHDSESRRFRHGIGMSLGWQLLVHSFAGEYPTLNTFNVGLSYFFG